MITNTTFCFNVSLRHSRNEYIEITKVSCDCHCRINHTAQCCLAILLTRLRENLPGSHQHPLRKLKRSVIPNFINNKQLAKLKINPSLKCKSYQRTICLQIILLLSITTSPSRYKTSLYTIKTYKLFTFR